jgi:N-acetylglutamate synthase-like GNAT family acetyltransferase
VFIIEEIVIYQTTSLCDVERLKYLLNKYVSFGLATTEYVESLVQKCKVYVATDGDKIVGTATLEFTGKTAEVKHLVVDESYRKLGIGGRLLKFVLDANSTVVLTATGWVKPTGWDAEGLFLSQEFVVVSEDKNYWKSACTSATYCPYFSGECNCSCKLVERRYL